MNQINAGETIEIEVGIQLLTTDAVFEISLLNKESTLTLSGTYKNSTEKEINVKGTRTVKLEMLSPYDENNTGIELNQTVLTNKTFQYNGTESRIIQLKVESVLNGNQYPVKTSKLELTAPTLQGNYPKTVTIQTPETLVTNGKMLENNDYTYNDTTGKVQITIENVETEGKVSWNKTGKDCYIITYVFEGTGLPDEQQLQSKSEICLYDANQTILNEESQTTLLAQEMDTSIGITARNSEDEIYKGKLYAGIEREITQNIDIQVNLENIADNVIIEENFSNMNLSNIYTKTITINKDNFTKILGDDGYIKILNKDTNVLIEQITKDTQSDENRNVVITVPENTAQIKIETTKPIKSGNLNMTTTKVIKANEFDTVQAAKEMQYVLNSYYNIGETQNVLSDASSKITLKETQTSAELTVSQTEFSTKSTNENVQIRATLHSNSEKDELYKNPHVKITLPEEFKKISVSSIQILNGEEFTVKSAQLQNSTIDIQFEGEQTAYKEQAIEGVTILIIANLTADKKQKTVDRQITLTYENQKAINYAEGGTTGIETKDIRIVTQGGFILTNEISDYNLQTVNNEGTKTAKLEMAAEEKTTTVTNEVINNQNKEISEMKILGTFPTQNALKENTIKATVEELQFSRIDSTKIHIYYSENENATTDLTETTNAWKETIENGLQVKKYLIVIDQFDADGEIQFDYNMTIPANLEYNEVASQNYKVYYTTEQTVEQSSGTLTLETGKGPVVETELKAMIAGKEADTAKEGEKIEYCITAQNTGSEVITNLQLTGKVPKGTVYVTEVKPNGEIEEGDGISKAFDEHPEQTEVVFNGISLQPGEKITKKYTVKIKKGSDTTIINKILTQYDGIQKDSNTVTTQVTKGDLELDIKTIRATIYDDQARANTNYSNGYADGIATGNKYWYLENTNERKSDAVDNYDGEMQRLYKINDDIVSKTRMKIEEQWNESDNMQHILNGTKVDNTLSIDAYTPHLAITVERTGTKEGDFKISNIDFGLAERPRYKVQISKQINRIQLIQPDGSILRDFTDFNNPPANTKSIKSIRTVNKGIVQFEIDSELLQTTTLLVEYGFTVKNVSEVEYKDESYYKYGVIPSNKEDSIVRLSIPTIIDYIDNELMYSANSHMITEGNKKITNEASGWSAIDLSKEENKKYLSEDVLKALYQDGKCKYNKILISKGLDEEQEKNMLKPGDTKSIAVLLNKTLVPTKDEMVYENTAEIVEVKKTWGRELHMENTSNSSAQKLGNLDPTKEMEVIKTKDLDSGYTEKILINPPTGENQSNNIYVVLGVICISIITAGIILIKKKVL